MSTPSSYPGPGLRPEIVTPRSPPDFTRPRRLTDVELDALAQDWLSRHGRALEGLGAPGPLGWARLSVLRQLALYGQAIVCYPPQHADRARAWAGAPARSPVYVSPGGFMVEDLPPLRLEGLETPLARARRDAWLADVWRDRGRPAAGKTAIRDSLFAWSRRPRAGWATSVWDDIVPPMRHWRRAVLDRMGDLELGHLRAVVKAAAFGSVWPVDRERFLELDAYCRERREVRRLSKLTCAESARLPWSPLDAADRLLGGLGYLTRHRARPARRALGWSEPALVGRMIAAGLGGPPEPEPRKDPWWASRLPHQDPAWWASMWAGGGPRSGRMSLADPPPRANMPKVGGVREERGTEPPWVRRRERR